MSTMTRRASGLYVPRSSASWSASVLAIPNLKWWSRLADTATPWSDDSGGGHTMAWGTGQASAASGATSDGNRSMTAGSASGTITSASWMDTVGSWWGMLWIKTAGSGTERHGFSRWNNNTNYMFSMGISTTNKGIMRNRTSASNNNVIGAVTVNDNGWHMLFGTYDGTTQRLYVDGSPDGTAALSPGTGLQIGQNLRLGSGFTGAAWTNGDGMDEAAFGGSATAGIVPSAADIAALWAAR